MNTHRFTRVATATLGLVLAAGLLHPTSATAEQEVTGDGPAVTAPTAPTPLGPVEAQPLPTEREQQAMTATAATLPEYDVIDLGGGHAGFAAEVNESGVIAGTIFPEGTAAAGRHARPAVWVGGVRHALDAGPSPTPIVHAGAIGDDGTVGGWEYDAATRTRYAVRWVLDEEGVYGPKERISEVRHDSYDGTGGEVQTISPDGALHVTEPLQHVPTGSDLVWDRGTPFEIAGVAGQYPHLSTWDMNRTRQLAGSLSTGTRMEGSRWPGGPNPEVLDRLIPESTWNQALAINEHGDVVMESFRRDVEGTPGVDRRVIAVGDGTRWTRLPELYGDDDRNSNLLPTDLNDRGDVVGEALIGIDGRQTTYAWLWRDGEMIDLNTLVPLGEGWELNAAYSINERGQIVGVGTHFGVRKPFLLDPTRPLVFIPGAGASILKSYDRPADPEDLWLGCLTDRMRLSLFPEDSPDVDVEAVDATRYLECGPLSGRHVDKLDAYGTMLDLLTTEHGYREYLVEEKVERFTTEGCDLTQRDRAPNLFVFAYDWRLDNRLTAEKLDDFLGCIRRFYPDTEIDVLTHSMGSLVARRHILMNPGSTGFHQVVTIGAPWLGAPKLVNVLNTGDFAKPVAYGPEVAHIVSGFPAAHQLMAGPYYHRYVAPAFAEDGTDFDGDGTTREVYDWENLRAAYDRRWSRTTPATTAGDFQEFGGEDGQADWRQDSSGLDYVHIYGVQDGLNTPGRTVASHRVTCDFSWPISCKRRHVFDLEMTEGDETVPTMSASRLTPEADLNAPGATLVRLQAEDSDDNHRVEHTTLTRHPDALRAAIAAFQDRDAAVARIAAAGAAAEPAPYRYVEVTGGADVVLSDGTHDDAPVAPGSRVTLPGTNHLSQGPGSELVTMPAQVDHSWTVSFVGRGEPVYLEMLRGTQQDPTDAVRWQDLVLEGGQAAELVMTPTGLETLRVDSDGDGEVDRVVPPTTDVSGTQAADTEAPVVGLASVPVLDQRRLVVTATDGGGSGVESTWYSTDGTTFEEYAAPFIAPDRGVVWAFAQDRAGNRSPMAELSVDDATTGPMTRAVLDPEPDASGWTRGDTSVRLVASSDASAVAEVQWRTAGAQVTELTSTPGGDAELVVTEPGTTTVTFRSVAEDGTVEPWREQVVRVDGAAPTSRLRAPLTGAAVASLSQLAGTASDDASGVTSVEVLLERTLDGATWDGDAWVEERSWLATTGTRTWRTTDVPTGAAFLPGGYAVRVRVTDAAGRVATSPASTFTMAADGRLSVLELPPMPDAFGYTSGADLDDRGVVAGTSHSGDPLRWTNGRPERLRLPEGVSSATLRAIGPDGSVVGSSLVRGEPAVRWDDDGTPHPLALPALDGASMPYDVSAAGVVGLHGLSPVWWPSDDRVVVLPTRAGDQRAVAEGIDDHGTIVGHVVDRDDVQHAAVWTDRGRTLTLLGTLGGEGSRAVAINEVGQVVGTAAREDGTWVPFVADLWNGGELVAVPVPEEGNAVPEDINDAGTIVGEVHLRGESQGFSIEGGSFRYAWEMVPDDTSWSIHRFYAVNELGQLTGFGFEDSYRGFMASTPHAPVATDAVVDTDAGTPVEVTLAVDDPDPGTTLSREVVDRPAHGTLSDVDGDVVTYTPEPGFHGTDEFTWRGHDGALGSNLATVTVRVRPGVDTNQRPVAVLTAPETAPEGASLVLDATGSYDTDGSLASYAWDLDGDGEHDDATGATTELPVPREGLRTVSLQVRDDDGATGTTGATVRVVNVAPLVTLPPTAEAEAGEELVLAGSFTDPGQDAWTATVDTGAGREPLPLDGRDLRVPVTLDEPGEHPVEVRVCDETDCGTATTVVTVRRGLDARITAPATAREGDRVTLDATGSTGATAYAWDLDGDGEHDDATGTTASVLLEQDGERTIGLRVTGAGGREASTSHVVSVANVLPVVTLPVTASAVVGSPWTLDGSFADPGADAYAAYADLGAGEAAVPLTGSSFRLAHTFTAPGTRPVALRVCDDDGCTTATVAVTVTAAQPAAWPWQGFFAPVDNLPVVNTVKAGQAIPMKFSLGGDRGLAIFADGSPVSVRHGCGTTGGTDAIETTVSPGASELSYAAGSDRYQYVWKTQKAWAGQCRTFRMTLVDGSVHEAEFRFR